MQTDEYQSNRRGILKASSLIGGSALINILIGMVKTKFVAVLLGTSGVGLIGVYNSIIAIVSTVSAMGIGTSGVRQVAEAHGKGDVDTTAKTVVALRRAVWITGSGGLLAMGLGCAVWSQLSFDNSDHAVPIAVLGVVVLLTAVTLGQSCVLQGTRRIADLAKIRVLGALSGTIISIPCFYFFGQQGIAISLVLCAVAALVISWWFARRVVIVPIESPWSESRSEVFQLLHFGLPIMLSSLLTALSAFLIRALLIRQVGLDGVGIYQAAFLLSGVLVNFVLGAMGADYYPRLTAVAHDNARIGIEVNAQTEIGLLLAVPGLAATMIFAPLAISIFYSKEFGAAIDILRWMVFGVFGRIVSWPLGFVILAKGMGKTFFVTGLSSNLFYVLATWLCTDLMGLPGTGVAFALLYVFATCLVLAVAYALTRQTWTAHNLVQILVFGGVLAGLGLNCAYVPIHWLHWIISLTILLGLSTYCLHRLSVTTGVTLRSLKRRFFNRATSYSKRGDHDLALADLKQALALRPDDPVDLNRLARFLATCEDERLRDADQAVKYAEQATTRRPDEGPYWTTLGLARYRAGQWQQASDALHKARQAGSDDCQNQWFQAMSDWQLGHHGQARKWYEQAMASMEQNPAGDDEQRFKSEAAELLGLP